MKAPIPATAATIRLTIVVVVFEKTNAAIRISHGSVNTMKSVKLIQVSRSHPEKINARARTSKMFPACEKNSCAHAKNRKTCTNPVATP